MTLQELRQTIRFGPYRRIARESSAEERQVNPLYSMFSKYFETVLAPTDPSDWTSDLLTELYTCRRLSDFDSEPEDSIYQQKIYESGLTYEVGETESKLLDWVVAKQATRVLSVLGLRGVGKSSLLHYVRQVLLPVVAPEFHLIHVDVRETHDLVSPLALHYLLYRTALNSLGEVLQPSDIGELTEYESQNEELDAIAFDSFLESLAKRLRAINIKPILILDSVDQVTPDSVSRILELARIVSLRNGLRTIVALRPPVFWVEVEKQQDRDGFVRNSVTVRPPDLGHLLSRRFESLLNESEKRPTSFRLVARNSLPIEIRYQDAVDMMEQVSSFFLSRRVQRTIACDLCRYDIRKTFEAVKAYLRYSDLPVEQFANQYLLSQIGIKKRPNRRKDPNRRLIQGIMVQDGFYYRERQRDSPTEHAIINLFSNGSRSVGQSCNVQYRLLSLLAWRSVVVRRDWCIEQLRVLGFHSRIVMPALSRLLRFGLLFSPQSEYEIGDAEEIRISSSGRYYLEHLAGNKDYLYNVIMDTPLAHRRWDDANPFSQPTHRRAPADFEVRLNSIFELLTHVVDAESDELERMPATVAAWAAPMISDTSLLSSRLLHAVSQVVDDAKRSPHRAIIDAVGNISSFVSDELAPAVAKMENRLSDLCWRQNDTELVIACELSGAGNAELRLQCNEQNSMLLEVSIHEMDKLRGHPLSALVDLESGDVFEQDSPCLFFNQEAPKPQELSHTKRLVIRRASSGEAIRGKVLFAAAGSILECQEFAERKT